MRWFIIFLVVANVVLFFLLEYESRPSREAMRVPEPDVGSLTLLSEMPAANIHAEPQDSAGAPADDIAESLPLGTDSQDTDSDDDGTVQHIKEAVKKGAEKLGALVTRLASGNTEAPERDSDEAVTIQDAAVGDERSDSAEMPATAVEDSSHDFLSQQNSTTDETTTAEGDSTTAPGDTPPQEVIEISVANSGGQMENGLEGETIQEQEPALPTGEPMQAAAEPHDEVTGDQTSTDSVVPSTEQPTEQTVEAESERAVADKATACWRVGPLEGAEVTAVKSALPATLHTVSQTTESYPHVEGYYVVVPALASRAEGQEKVKELRAAGITDVWLFRSGPLNNAISLGLFSRRPTAERHAESVAKKGFQTAIAEKTSPREGQWLIVSGESEPTLDAISGLQEQTKSASVECP